jgi:antitoxin VapB
MPLNIRSEEVNQLAEQLASRTGVSKTEAVRIALTRELERQNRESDAFIERIKQLQDELASYPRTGLKADKAFYDSLNDERRGARRRSHSKGRADNRRNRREQLPGSDGPHPCPDHRP